MLEIDREIETMSNRPINLHIFSIKQPYLPICFCTATQYLVYFTFKEVH